MRAHNRMPFKERPSNAKPGFIQLRRRHDDPRWLAKAGLLCGLAIGAVAMLLLLPAIPQDLSYHRFADAREMLGIPNFWNVASNLPLLLVGVAGLLTFARGTPAGSVPALHVAYRVFFAGIALIAAGSSWYHLDPSNASLVWDRLPMSLTFMAFLAVIIGENVSLAGGIRLLWPLVTLGLLAVLYWYTSELAGAGDLRPYVLVQFLPLLLIPVMLLLFRAAFSGNAWIWLTLCLYGAAKVAEHADQAIFEAIGIGGHAIKHLLSALGALCFLIALLRRRGTGAPRRDWGNGEGFIAAGARLPQGCPQPPDLAPRRDRHRGCRTRPDILN